MNTENEDFEAKYLELVAAVKIAAEGLQAGEGVSIIYYIALYSSCKNDPEAMKAIAVLQALGI